MIAVDLGVARVDEALRLLRALGSHRYVAGRLHLVHVFAIASLPDDAGGTLGPAREWARATMEQRASPARELELGSRDERLWRRCSDAEVVAVVEAFWSPGPRSRTARRELGALLDRHGLDPGAHDAFDEGAEASIHPLAVDAGWELLRLGELDPERHKGAIAAFGDPSAFAAASGAERAVSPAPSYLCELPALGPVELLRAADDEGALARPFIVWAQGEGTYLDYVLRGIARAAKLERVP
jgi:hypothetical protein